MNTYIVYTHVDHINQGFFSSNPPITSFLHNKFEFKCIYEQ